MKKLLCVLLFFVFTSSHSQTSQIDSLQTILKSTKQDSVRVRLLLSIIEQLSGQDPDSAGKLINLGIDICNKDQNIKNSAKTVRDVFKKQYGYLYINLGNIDYLKGDMDQAIKQTYQGLGYLKALNDLQGMGLGYSNLSQYFQVTGVLDSAIYYAESSVTYFKRIHSVYYTGLALNTLGIIYDYQGNYPKALSYYFEALKLIEEAKSEKGTALIKHNIGAVYEAQRDLVKAQEFYEFALEHRLKINDQFGIGESYIALGKVMKKRSEFSKAFEFYNKALAIQQKLNDLPNLAVTYNNIGQLYRLTGDKQKAAELLHKSIDIQMEIKDKNGLVFSYNNLGTLYLEQKQYDKAIPLALKALQLGTELGYPENIRNSSMLLYELYSLKKDYRSALDYYKLHVKMRDSLNNIEAQKATIQQQEEYNYSKKQAMADEKHSAELLIQKEKSLAEKKRQNTIIVSVSIVLLLVAFFSVLLYNRFKTTQRQKVLIEQKEKETFLQKKIIEEKHKEITDSINYAERIQRALLASREVLDENLKEYFILFKPKDVVSGDFYWATRLSNDEFALVTADSTGHGVPGAIMSIVNIACLNEAVKEGITLPNEILNRARKEIITVLRRDGSVDGGKDGMDCSLISLNRERTKLQVASAHNPVWIVRNGKLIDIKADNMPVGKHDKQDNSFTLHEIDLQKNDVIYTLTDGFPDQFGGERGKKFMARKLKELVMSISEDPMIEQRQILEQAFKDWIGNLEQIDDVTIIGIKV